MKRLMSVRLSKRQRLMRHLYRTNYSLYEHVCDYLQIKCVKFATPDSRHPSKAINPVAVDSDRARFLIRQKLWKGRHRPRAVRKEGSTGSKCRYTRHPVEPPPANWNVPSATPESVATVAWPYAQRTPALSGGRIRIPNPTAPGKGHVPVPVVV